MALNIVPYEPQHAAAVADFNRRAAEHGAPFGLSKTARPDWLPDIGGRALHRRYFLAIEGGAVRGGYTIRDQPFRLHGREREVANYQGPLSEGLWERRCMMTGVQMLRAALRDRPLLYAIGMGGMGQPLPKLLAAAGWALAPVPFLFKVLRPARFLREIRPLRRTRARALALDLAALSGIGPLAIHIRQRWRTRQRLAAGSAAEPVREFGPWADQLWEQARDASILSAVRDRAVQNILFGDGNEKNRPLRCTRAGRDIGWAVVRSTPMRDDHYFGSMRVGSLVDCLAVPGEEFTVAALATRHLQGLGSDLVVTNQTHHRWTSALRDCGYLDGPSNYIFACSPALASELGPLDQALGKTHFNRADGDGPIHL